MHIRLPHLAAFWDNAVAKLPHAPAIIAENHTLTYADADALVARLSAYLADVAGVGKGDRVCLALPNCPESILAYWATLRLGAVVAPINTTTSRACGANS